MLQFFDVYLSPKFLDTGITDVTFHQDTSRHITLATIYKISGSHFFTATTEIHSKPDFLDESRLVIIFLTNFGVREILCNFRLVIEGTGGKEVHESSKPEFSSNLILLDPEVKTSKLLNRANITDLS